MRIVFALRTYFVILITDVMLLVQRNTGDLKALAGRSLTLNGRTIPPLCVGILELVIENLDTVFAIALGDDHSTIVLLGANVSIRDVNFVSEKVVEIFFHRNIRLVIPFVYDDVFNCIVKVHIDLAAVP